MENQHRHRRPFALPHLTRHALDRWRERVTPAAHPGEIPLLLTRFVQSGKRRPTPRHWTAVQPEPGLTFIYWAELPYVCALVRDGTVITILTRALCKGTTREDPAA